MKNSIRLLFVAFLVPGSLMAQGTADHSTPYAFSTLAGISSIGSQNGTGTAARFYSPRAVAVDTAGNAFVVDTGNHTIRKITPAGVATTFAGLEGAPGNMDGTGGAARFESPQDIVADAAGNLFVTDTGNHTIRKITPGGVVTTLAGAAGIPGKIDGLAGAARFNEPLGLAIDAASTIYVTEAGNGTIRKITPEGAVTTYASNLRFREPYYNAISVDASGAVYVVQFAFRDYQNYYIDGVLQAWEVMRDIGFLCQVLPGGEVRYLLQTTEALFPPAVVTAPSVITDVVAEPAGRLILAGFHGLHRFTPADHMLTRLSGSGQVGSIDGAATAASFSNQFGIAAHPAGGFIVADAGNNKVRRIGPNGEVSTVAGIALDQATNTVDGAGTAARFAAPGGMARDAAGNLYVADTGSHCIRKITPAGNVTTFAGTPGSAGAVDGIGTVARFKNPVGLAVGPAGDLYVADSGNHTVRRISLVGEVTTIAGTPPEPNGPVNSVFNRPHGLAVNAAGTVFVADTFHSCIRMIAPDGNVQTFAGVAGESGTVDGIGSSARFMQPLGLTISAAGDLYVTESSDNPSVARVRRVAPNGLVTTLAGAEAGYADGSGTAARFHKPSAVTVDAAGNLFVADSYNQAIRQITSAGVVTTVAGLVDAPGSSDGIGAKARFYYPQGIVADTMGDLYVSSGTIIRQGTRAARPVLTAQPANQSVQTGGGVTFSVTATSTYPLSYQWHFNGSPLPGATSSSLSLTNARASDAGDYTVTVSNDAGSVTSAKATLTVTAAPTSPPPSSTGGGGGAPSIWLLSGLLGLSLLRWFAPLRRQ